MTVTTQHNQQTISSLRQRWWGLTAVWTTVWLLTFLWLRSVWQPEYALRWLLLAGPALAVTLWIARRGLRENHREGEDALLPTLGWGNRLSLLRGLCIGMVAGFLFSPWPQGALGWLPVLLYTGADVADYLDGYLARITNHATRLGARLDMEYDGLGMFVVSVLAVWYGQLPWWYLLLGMARYFFVLGMWLRERRGLPLHDLHPSAHRRLFAGFQMGFMSAVLWPILPAAGATIAGTLFAIPTALGFLRDWLVVSGRIDPESAGYRRAQAWLVTATRRRLPLLLRPLLLASMAGIYITIENWLRPFPWETLLRSWGVPIAAPLAVLLGVIGLAGAALVAAGALPRLLALAVVFPVGFDIASRGLSWPSAIALTCCICLMLLGSGPGSLWPVEERFVLRKMGG